ncbi:MAG: hypothetical protein LAQ69_36015 [Acidobacteriia bacterium]|nr:hypothetical protein [Terriglobia bacterium]
MMRIPDARVRQFWDPEHLLAKELVRRGEAAKSNPSYPHPQCCVERGFEFDEAVLYAPGSRWRDEPAPRFWNGAVFEVIEDLKKASENSPRY